MMSSAKSRRSQQGDSTVGNANGSGTLSSRARGGRVGGGEEGGTVGAERGRAVRGTDIWESNALKRWRDQDLSLSLRSGVNGREGTGALGEDGDHPPSRRRAGRGWDSRGLLGRWW